VLKPINARASRRTCRARRAGGALPATTQTDQGRGGRTHEHRPSDSTHINHSHCKMPDYTGGVPVDERQPPRITATAL
jgi:hypothetical protein